VQTGNLLLVLSFNRHKADIRTLAGLCNSKGVVVVILVAPHKRRDMLSGDKLHIMA
jgi:hypothetical protein